MEESAEVEVQPPVVSCGYVAAAASTGGAKHEPGCDPAKAKCINDDPKTVWKKNMYSICRGGKSGQRCDCYWEDVKGSGFEMRCYLYPELHVDMRGIWNIEYMNKLRRSLGITK